MCSFHICVRGVILSFKKYVFFDKSQKLCVQGHTYFIIYRSLTLSNHLIYHPVGFLFSKVILKIYIYIILLSS